MVIAPWTAAPAPPVFRGGDSPTIPTWKLEGMGTR
jgi:hypothetical protein